MIEEKAYTRQEIRELLNTNANNQSIKRMLERRGYEFSFEGRGGNAVFTITKLPSKFKLFCFEELNVRPQTDFTKLRNFFYYYLDDEDFRNLPDTIKSERMGENGMPLSRQTIGRYEQYLYSADYFWPDFTEFKYYLTHREDGVKIAKEIDRKTYANAWAVYWQMLAETKDTMRAIYKMLDAYGGYPNKSPIINKSSIMEKKVEELNELVIETFYE